MTTAAASKASLIKKQIEYYMSDQNLKRDDFFYDEISKNKEGWFEVSLFMNCNKIKELKIKVEDLVSAVADSDKVELSKDKKKIRRTNNPPLPNKEQKNNSSGTKKREAKANKKEEAKEEKKSAKKEAEGEANANGEQEEKYEEAELDGRGNYVFVLSDFENPVIVQFQTDEKKAGADYKVSWKDVETTIKNKYKTLKIVYKRSDNYSGELAISSHNMDKKALQQLLKSKETINDKEFTFVQLEGTALKQFWDKEINHYNFCIEPKKRNAKKKEKIRKQEERKEKALKPKLSFEIAGAYYADINKVKSKSRAILNLKKDGEKLTGNDEAFMKELIKYHSKHEEKMKDFDHFEVGQHPNFEKTRCFFIVRKDGKKEDFSVGKCTQNLEKASKDQANE